MDDASSAPPTTRQVAPAPPVGGPLDREILRLALPALAALIAEPLLLLADSAIVGHLGTEPLAGLGIAANLLSVVIGLCVFLAYGTTGTVARLLGAGDQQRALAGGVDGLALATLLGIALAALVQSALPSLISAYGAPPEVATQARDYLRVAAFGLPSLLLILAGTGVLRGLQDTRTPLLVVLAANVANVGLNLGFVYGLGLGIAGSALGTVVAQTGAAAAIVWIVLRKARAARVRLGVRPRGVLAAARAGIWLVVRTATLTAGVALTTVVAAAGGTITLAAHQVVGSLWILLAFALDAIAIAGQAIIGRALGAGDVALGRAMTRRMMAWGAAGGAAFGIVLVVSRPLYLGLFTPDLQVQHLMAEALVVVAVLTPFAGIVYVLDGVLIGAGDGRYLAVAGACALVGYLPLALLVRANSSGLVWLWASYGVFMGIRLLTLTLRVRTDVWLRAGPDLATRRTAGPGHP